MDKNMELINELYQKRIAENEHHLKFWGEYLNGLKSINFDFYADKLRVPALVPIGRRIFFRGELKHTNEVTVYLGANYYVKCSIAQAEILRQRRIKETESNLDLYRVEKEHIESQISFTKQNVYEEEGQDILEVYSEEEDKIWRKIHREKVRKDKQRNAKDESKPKEEITDKELWERLEELELQEELENEMLDNYNEIIDKRKDNAFLVNEKNLLLNSFKKESNNESFVKDIQEVCKDNNYINNEVENVLRTDENKEEITNTTKVLEQSLKEDLLQQIVDKQNELENKLQELKYKEKGQIKSEQDLIKKIDEMEELDEIEDEVERLDDIIQIEDVESDYNSQNLYFKELKKGISFADDSDSQTIDINFTHSEIVPDDNPYNPETGITKPSDLYKAYANHFDNKTTSILKKSKYGPDTQDKKAYVKEIRKANVKDTVINSKSLELQGNSVDKTIVVKDVVETVGVNQHKIEGGTRPTSLFKMKRMHNKS